MAILSNILAWKIPQKEEPGGHKELDATEHAHMMMTIPASLTYFLELKIITDFKVLQKDGYY